MDLVNIQRSTMKQYTLTLLVLFVIACTLVYSSGACSDDEFAAFKTEFKKNYKSEEEEANRRDLFCKAKALVTAHNERFDRGEESYSLGINDFSDWTQEEVQKRLLGGKKDRNV